MRMSSAASIPCSIVSSDLLAYSASRPSEIKQSRSLDRTMLDVIVRQFTPVFDRSFVLSRNHGQANSPTSLFRLRERHRHADAVHPFDARRSSLVDVPAGALFGMFRTIVVDLAGYGRSPAP
jgi:hypothetical protein